MSAAGLPIASTPALRDPRGIMWHHVFTDASATFQVVRFDATGNRVLCESPDAATALAVWRRYVAPPARP